jgi:integrase/recombinase XerD
MSELNQPTLFDNEGGRKYLCGSETRDFIAAAEDAEEATRLFCFLLAFAGCRISEALALTPSQLDHATGRVVFRTLKRRSRVFRAVPVPPRLLADLIRFAANTAPDVRIWGWSRPTAWRRVKEIMAVAGITGPQAMPKGLRHGFGCANAEGNVPMATTQKWLGHASLETTAIYQQAVGIEERAFARRLWRQWSRHNK